MNRDLRIGFIGLGDQGAPMAAAIADHYALHVWARREAAYAALADAPHIRAASAVELAARVDVLCLCLRNDADLHTLLGDGALLGALGRDKIIINHATGDPIESEGFERLSADYGVHFFDAPVSGGRPGAEARSLTCFIGGQADVLSTCRDVIACHSSSIIPMGPSGSGQMAKLCNNALTISNLRNIVEVFSMADRLGLSLDGLRQAFAQSSGGSFILQALGDKVTVANAAHIADLNRTDLREFADAMKRKQIDPDALVEWGIKGPDGLADLVRRLQQQTR